MNEVRPKPEFLRPGPVPDAQEMIRVEELGQERWARTRIQRMRERVEEARRKQLSLLLYTAALGFVQVFLGRLLVMGVGVKNIQQVDPMELPSPWRERAIERALFAYDEHQPIVLGLVTLLFAAMAAAVVVWGMRTSPSLDGSRVSPNLRHRRGKRRD